MQIIIPPREYTEGDRAKAIEREFRTGMQLKKAQEAAREQAARKEAQGLKGHKPIKGLGRCTAVMGEWEFYRLVQKYGYKEVHSKPFMKYLQRAYPDLAPHKL